MPKSIQDAGDRVPTLPITLTSPHTKGLPVTRAQTLLKKNRFGQDFLRGPIDGEFGPLTKGAVKRAKYWLGYADWHQDGSYGDQLRDRLLGPKKGGIDLTLIMRKRRKARLAAAATKPLGEKALAMAITQLGTKENPPGSNIVKYSRWYGMVGSWCAMFASWVLHEVGSSFHYAYVPYVVHDAKAGRNGLQVVAKPFKGDLACYDWNGDGVADHIGFVMTTLKSDGSFSAVEGNTAVGNDSNGGEVMVRQRHRSDVQVFVRVGR